MSDFAQTDSIQQPVIRWSVVFIGAGALALAIGYFAGRATTIPETVNVPKAVEPKTQLVEPEEPTVTDAALADPERPRPKSIEELIQEVQHAIAYLQTVFPAMPDALEMKARTEKWLGHSGEAIKVWQRCLELDSTYVHAFVGMAQTAAEKGNHEEAAKLARQAIELDPANFQARYTLADSLVHLRRPAEAVTILKDSLKSDPRSLGFFKIAQAYFDLKQFELARDNLEAAIRKYPDYTEAYYLLSRTYRELGDETLAKQRLEEYQKLSAPKKLEQADDTSVDTERMFAGAAVIYTDAGRLFMLREKELDAELFWRRAAQLDPKNVPCRQSLAFLARKQERLGETICWFKELAKIEPANSTYWIEMGRLYEELNALPAAENAFRKGCEVAPEKSDGYSALADLFLRHDRNPPETQKLAEKAVELNPAPQNYALLSAACRANGDDQAALVAIEKALELAPQSASYRAVRDSIKKTQGDE